MKVYGELEVAQFEGFATGALPPASTNYRRVVYDTTENVLKVSDGASWRAVTAGTSKYKFVVGASAEADFSTLTAALIAHPTNTSFLLDSTYAAVENVVIAADGVLIEGQGIISVITGNVTINTGVKFTRMSNLKVTGNIVLSTSSANNSIENIFVSSTSTVTDNGVNDTNNFLVLQL